MDLGSGDGSYTLALAEHYPERNFLAVERLLGRVQRTCRGAKERGLTNLKVLRLESAYTAEWLLPRHSVSRLHLVCPDPWPKAKHHRRRMIQQEFLETVHQLLVPGGVFIFKTDHEEYFEWAEEELAQFPKLKVTPFPEEYFDPKSDFQLAVGGGGEEPAGFALCESILTGQGERILHLLRRLGIPASTKAR